MLFKLLNSCCQLKLQFDRIFRSVILETSPKKHGVLCCLRETYRDYSNAYNGAIKPGQFSYVNIPGEFPLTQKTVGQLVDSAAEKFGSKEALYVYEENKRLSFEQIKEESDKFASGLIKLGFKPGDRIGIWGPNSRQWYITELAAAKAGIISVFLNPAYQTRELLYGLNKVNMNGIVVAGNFKTQNYFSMLTEAVPEINSSPLGKIQSEKAPHLTTVISMEETAPGKSAFTYNQVLEDGASKDALLNLEQLQPQIQFDDVCNIQFTSGTTGNPKGVMLSHHNIVNNSFLIGKRMGMNGEDKLCLTVPLFHCYGNIVGMLAGLHYGASAVFPSPGFNAQAGVKVAAEEKCTMMFGTPTMHIDMLNVPEIDSLNLSSLRMAVTAGAICPEELVKEMKVKYTVDSVTSVYGLTETSPAAFASLSTDDDVLRSTTVGYPLEHTEIKLVDKEGRIVPTGTEGEMCMRGYLVMLGYWQDPQKTQEAVDQARWFHTGDLCIMSETGHSRVVGRLKDMIIRGGENIYPREIEDFLHTHPDIVEAQVFGIPDKRLGETVAVWLRLKEGKALNAEDVKAFCKGQISHFKIPQYMTFTSDFPKTTSGKIQKFVMRAKTIEELNLK